MPGPKGERHMSSSLITGKYVVCKANSRFEAEIIEDGAIYQKEGKIVAIGKRDELAAKYQADEVIGSPDHVVMPGFVNAHHHVGLTPVQLGSRDYALELWLAKRAVKHSPACVFDQPTTILRAGAREYVHILARSRSTAKRHASP